MEPPVGFAPTWTCLQDRCLSVSATEEDGNDEIRMSNDEGWKCRPFVIQDSVIRHCLTGAPARICTSSLHFRKVACMFSYTSGACELVRHVGAAPTCRVWKTRMFLLHQCRDGE